MTRFNDMLVETGYRLIDVEDRVVKLGHPRENQCTYCGVQDGDRWHPVEDITVYRVWTADSLYRPDNTELFTTGGTWQWRCPAHPKRAWAPHSHEAPDELLPPEKHSCEEIIPLSRTRCGETDGTRRFVEGWYCGDHCHPYENNARARILLGDEDPEAGETASTDG
jgi:hypothetical protein